MSTAQTTCTLGTYKFHYNAPKQVAYQPKSISYQPSIQGGYFTSYGVIQSDAIRELTWAVCPADIYNGIYAQYILAGPLTFIDWTGTSMTVQVMDFKPEGGVVPAGVDAYLNVVLKLQVVSIP